MKKTLLIIGISASLFSCKKATEKEFTATDITGLGTLKGTVTRNVNVRNTAGNGITQIQEPVAGVEVSVRILNTALYINNSNAQGAKNYYGTTDANGNYSIQAKVNEQGSTATITVPDVIGTIDTIVAGVRKTGFAARFNGNNGGNNITMFAAAERNFPYNYGNGVLIGGNQGDQQVGDFKLSGTVWYETVRAFTSPSGSLTTSFTYSVAAPNVWVTATNSQDPSTLTQKTYTTTTDISGKYTFTIAAHMTNSTNMSVKLYDYVHTRDTTVYSNASFTTITTPAKTGKPGFYDGTSFGLGFQPWGGEIRVQNHTFFGFTAY